MTTIDVSYRLTGTTVPLDHSYPLYSALSHLIPDLHEAKWLGIHPIGGVRRVGKTLELTPHSSLQLRLPLDKLSHLRRLANSRFALNPGHPIKLDGAPTVRFLTPASTMSARQVMFRVEGFSMEPNQLPQDVHLDDNFLVAANRQLRNLGIVGRLHLRGLRRLTVKGLTLIAYSVDCSGLSAEHSLLLQERGLGGKRRMGCGLFRPKRSR